MGWEERIWRWIILLCLAVLNIIIEGNQRMIMDESMALAAFVPLLKLVKDR